MAPKGGQPPAGGTALFQEDQRFRQPWLWALVVVAAVGVWVGATEATTDRSDGSSRWPLIAMAVFVGVGPLLFALLRLRVELFADRVVLRYRPLTTRTIELASVTRVEAITYRPLREYGGWGIKGWSRRKVAYNVYGNRGVRLTLADGRTVLIGSQRPDELAAALRPWVSRPGEPTAS